MFEYSLLLYFLKDALFLSPILYLTCASDSDLICVSGGFSVRCFIVLCICEAVHINALYNWY